jgi:hypothetical protein
MGMEEWMASRTANMKEVIRAKSDGLVVNKDGGMKYDGTKVRPSLLLKSMPDAVAAVIDVLEYGARKYDADNWKKVEHSRYIDASLRHYVMRYLAGEQIDPESGKHHLAHAICCLMFMLQMELENKNKT